ncbi:unnamed protein product, partial [Owenia fusiformis]
MSAESPRRPSRGGGLVVRPQPMSDKSVMDSVVDFFQEALPQAYSGAQKPDDREKVLWVSFQEADLNDIGRNPDCRQQSGNTPPIVLVIGYSNGVQIWSIPGSGEAQELYSTRQGPVKTLKILPTPENVFGNKDVHAAQRPIVAICDSSSAGKPFCSVKFVSLRSGDEVHNIAFNNPVNDVHVNKRVVVVTFKEKIAAFDSCMFKQRFWVTSCFPCPGPNSNPIALGTRWLAYADKKLVAVHQSCGGVTGDGAQSYAATVISAAKTISKGLSMFSETVVSSVTGAKVSPTPQKKEMTHVHESGHTPGVVTIIDIQTIGEGQVNIAEESEGEGLIAHFPAHAAEPITTMAFDPTGTLLLCVPRLGHYFYVFRILAHPWSSSLGAVHHLHTLYRGETTAKVQDIAFTRDSRWVAISTLRGTTHVFPISTYGGPITVRTHTSPRTVNRASKFHKSAGLEDLTQKPQSGVTGQQISVAPSSGSPGTSPFHDHLIPSVNYQNALNSNMNNPRLPPYPHPYTVLPLVQVKQGTTLQSISSTVTNTKSKTTNPVVPSSESVCVASYFTKSRGWVLASPTTRDKEEQKRAVDSLFILNAYGVLSEYVLEPKPKSGLDKVTEDSPIEVTETPRAQWILTRGASNSELKPPLLSNNPLLLATDAVTTQQPSEDDCDGVPRTDSQSSLSSDHSSKGEWEDQWLSQVEIVTHIGPHRRLWMGPQFSFKTFQNVTNTTVLSSNSSALLSQSPETAFSTMDIVTEDVDLQSLKLHQARSSPVAMPGARGSRRHSSGSGSDHFTPNQYDNKSVLTIEAGSYEQSPSLSQIKRELCNVLK